MHEGLGSGKLVSLVIISFEHEQDTEEVEWNARGLVVVIDSWL
jgi:hypothetical protein